MMKLLLIKQEAQELMDEIRPGGFISDRDYARLKAAARATFAETEALAEAALSELEDRRQAITKDLDAAWIVYKDILEMLDEMTESNLF